MQAIYFSETKRKLQLFFAAHNAAVEFVTDSRGRLGRNRNKTLGAAHVKCAWAIIEIFAAQLNAIGLASLKEEIPNVFTSNGQLAQMLHCNARTIQRYITRLMQAKIITSKTFHGSTHAFELSVNKDVINLAPVLTIAYIRNLENEAETAMLNEAATACLDRETQKINKKLIRAEELLATHKSTPINNSVSFSFDSKSDDVKAPGNCEKLPGAGTSGEMIQWAVMLWNYCLRVLYFKIDFIADSEKIFALNFFLNEMNLSHSPAEQKTIFHSLKQRIDVAATWLRKDERRYIPVPSKYFSLTNSGGFSRTKIWLQKTQKATANEDAHAFHLAQKEAKIFNRYMNFYLRNKDFKTYRYVENYFQKNRPEMLEQFHEVVIEDQHGLNHISNILKLKTA